MPGKLVTDETALHRMVRKSWLEIPGPHYVKGQLPGDVVKVYERASPERMLLAACRAGKSMYPCQSPGLERLDSYKAKGTAPV